MSKHELVYTIDEAAKILGIGRNTAYAAVGSGILPSIRIGRSLRIPKPAFDKWLAEAPPKAALESLNPQVKKPRVQMITISVRLPLELSNKVVQSANERCVTLSAEVRDRLERTFGV